MRLRRRDRHRRHVHRPRRLRRADGRCDASARPRRLRTTSPQGVLERCCRRRRLELEDDRRARARHDGRHQRADGAAWGTYCARHHAAASATCSRSAAGTGRTCTTSSRASRRRSCPAGTASRCASVSTAWHRAPAARLDGPGAGRRRLQARRHRGGRRLPPALATHIPEHEQALCATRCVSCAP